MKFFKHLKQNTKWTFQKDNYFELIATPKSKFELGEVVNAIAISQPYLTGEVDLYGVSHLLNTIALHNPTNQNQKLLKLQLENQETLLLRLKNTLEGHKLPLVGKNLTRLEALANNFLKVTQLHAENLFKEYKESVKEAIALTQVESRLFDDVYRLVKLRYYCAVYFYCQKNSDSDFFVASILPTNDAITAHFVNNDYYSRNSYKTPNLFTVLDCFGNSSVISKNLRIPAELSLSIDTLGRNVFDTFVNHKYGAKTSNFMSENNSARVDMQYFVRGKNEYRKYQLLGKVKGIRQYNVSLRCGLLLDEKHTINYFESANAHCLGVSGATNYYVAFAVVANNKIVPTTIELDENGITADMLINFKCKIRGGSVSNFDVVTLYADSVAELANGLNNCNKFGYTACPLVVDNKVDGQLFTVKTNASESSNMVMKKDVSLPSRSLKYSYQFGNNSVATFLDNDGHSSTLLDGFAFGIEGERICAIEGNNLTVLNNGDFKILGDGFLQEKKLKKGNAKLEVLHENSKLYRVTFENPTKLLCNFAFEEQSLVSFDGNKFLIKSKNRSFTVVPTGEIESFSTNGIECNSRRLRAKLSGDLLAGQSLSICFARGTSFEIDLYNNENAHYSEPTIRESLLSTYLNYVNDKNLFCIKNRLKPSDALTVSALAYTNSAFLKQYIEKLENSTFIDNFETEYYDSSARLRKFVDKLQYALATVYYVAVAGDLDFLTEKRKQTVKEILFDENYIGKNQAICALALKKLAELDVDKVDVLTHYTKLRKVILEDGLTNSFAQAIGAVELENPTKARLKELCTIHGVPKSWYYVSQLENLYGVKFNCNTINLRPVENFETAFEQFVLNCNGNKIDTKFLKGNKHSVELNGETFYSTINLENLKEENTLVVRY